MKLTVLAVLLGAFVLVACQGAGNPPTAAVKGGEIKEISVQEASEAVKKDGVQFIDVRTPEEYRTGHAPKAVNRPLDTFEKDLAALDREKPVYVICQTGRRSQKAAEMLRNAEFKTIYNVAGGTGAWSAAGLPLDK